MIDFNYMSIGCHYRLFVADGSKNNGEKVACRWPHVDNRNDRNDEGNVLCDVL